MTASIDLTNRGHSVLLIEKNGYPNHKVCGEYVSNEVRPYLKQLGVDLNATTTVSIDSLLLTTLRGRSLTTTLPLGGFGLSRYAFDALLYEQAKKNKVQFIFEAAEHIDFHQNEFRVRLQSGRQVHAKQLLGAFGKRSNLDMGMERRFTKKKAPWLGVKCHYEYPNFPSNQVALHNFPGGYGGLSKTEDGSVNFCYLTTYESFKKEKNIANFNAHVVSKNPYLKEFLDKAEPKFDDPMAIAQISFDKKKAVENHVLMLGDAAGMIHPLCGNGMAMAIHSAKLASEAVSTYLEDKFSRAAMEMAYQKQWKRNFSHRMAMGRRLQSLLLNDTLSELTIGTIARSETLLKKLILTTHGKPILN